MDYYFRKKPIVIKAIRCSEALYNASYSWQDLPQWLRDVYDKGGVVFADEFISLPTLEGTMRADLDDWIICGVLNEVYPCKNSVFQMTYEPATKADPALAAQGLSNLHHVGLADGDWEYLCSLLKSDPEEFPELAEREFMLTEQIQYQLGNRSGKLNKEL